jgi:hypothetical protein
MMQRISRNEGAVIGGNINGHVVSDRLEYER